MRIDVKQHPVHGKFVRRRAERFWLLHPRLAVEDVYEQPKAVPIEAVVDPETVGWGGAGRYRVAFASGRDGGDMTRTAA